MKRFLSLGLVLAGLCMQCNLVSAGQKQGRSDDQISDQVRMRLAVDPDVKGGALDVTVNDGVVTIKGRVDTEKGKLKAEKLAKKVKGVKQVDNELVVGPPK
jgi:osmotically-inducible protein OsmY